MDRLTQTRALLWDPQAMPKRGPRPTLDFRTIAWAGIEIADRVGLAGLTMQAVAESLGVTKMALYRYVPGKAELVALMVDIGVGEAAAPRSDDEWRTALDRWAHELFERFRQHPWSLEATLGVRVIGPNELGWTEAVVAPLTDIGLTGGEILDIAVTLVGHIRNLAQQLTAVAGPGATSGAVVGHSEPETAMDASLRLLLRGRESQYPALSAALMSAVDDGAENQALEFGLGLILDGVERLLAARA